MNGLCSLPGLPTIAGETQSGSGGGYVAPGVRFGGDAVLVRTDPFTGVDSATGFISSFIYIDSSDANGAIPFFSNAVGVIFQINAVDGGFNLEIADSAYDSWIYATAAGAFPLNEWAHFLMAWDVGFATGSRRLALYVNDTPVSLIIGDDVGVSFLANTHGGQASVTNTPASPGINKWSDHGMWTGQSIIEANSTILGANRRKFVTADGKPVDPANWPANPLLKFSGNATGFATNQGTAGAFTTVGTITDTDSPSD